jgi:hypothetical protein
MNKIQKSLLVATIVGAVGISYALFTLRGLPETFDWDLEEDEEDE